MTASHDPEKTKGAAPNQENAPFATNESDNSWNTTAAQCTRALLRLRDGPVTTYELRREHDIYDPPSRVLQLRKHGHEILTLWQNVRTEAGVVHRVGQYCLIKEAV